MFENWIGLSTKRQRRCCLFCYGSSPPSVLISLQFERLLLKAIFESPLLDKKATTLSWLRDPCRIQTCNPHIRSVVLYSVELTDHCSFSKAGAKVLLFFDMTKYFCKKVQFLCIFLLFASKIAFTFALICASNL